MITPGKWQLAGPDRGEPLTRDRPPDPGHPAYIYVSTGDQEVVIAHVLEPVVWQVSGEFEEEQGEVPFGDPKDNGKLMTFSPALLRFVQAMAAMPISTIEDKGAAVVIVNGFKGRAMNLLSELAEVEVSSDADRW